MKFEIVVALKPEVLDTEGRAIQSSLSRLGHQSLQKVSVSKRFVLEFSGDPDEAFRNAEFLAKEHLTNPVSETFSLRRLTDHD